MNGRRSSPRTGMYPLALPAGAFALGIATAHYLDLPIAAWAAAAAIGGGAAYLLRERRGAAIALAVAFACAGAAAYLLEQAEIDPLRLKTQIDSGKITSGDPVEIEGRVAAVEPIPDGTFLTVEVERARAGRAFGDAAGNVRMFVPVRTPEAGTDLEALEIMPGAKLRTICRLTREEEYLNPGVAPRRELMDRMGIDASCAIKSPLLIEVTQTAGVLGNPFPRLRHWLIGEISDTFEPRTAGLLIALTQGNKYFLDRETAEVFREGGTFHILVISGLHITLIGGLILAGVRIFTRDRWAEFAVTTVMLWGMTMAVGGGVPAVRASVMFTVVLFARVINRESTLLNSLGAGALLLLVWRPSDLLDPSFQLTFGSMAGIVGLAFPIISKCRAVGEWTPTPEQPFPPNVGWRMRRVCEWLYWNPRRWEIDQGRQVWSAALFKATKEAAWRPPMRRAAAWIFEGVTVSLAVQVWLVPLSAYYFHRVTPGSVLLNLWAGPLLAAESIAAMLAVAASQAGEAVGLPFVVLTEALHSVAVWLPDAVTGWGWASWRVPVYSGAAKAIYAAYLVPVAAVSLAVFGWDAFRLIRQGWRGTMGVTSAGAAAVLGAVIMMHPGSAPAADGLLRVELLDVGQGDATLVTFPNGETMLVDGGGEIGMRGEDTEFERDRFRVGESVVSEFLWERGLFEISTIVGTHADADHIEGLADVARNFRIGQAILPEGIGADEEGSELLRELAGVPIVTAKGRSEWSVSGVRVTMFAAEGSGGLAENDRSIVLRLDMGERSVLLTGDVERAGEDALVKSGLARDADVVKAAHHGSRTSSTEEFVNAAGAEVVVVPVGRKSRFGHPHADVIERWERSGAQVLTSGSRGTVTVVTDGRGLSVSTFKKE